MLVNCEIFATFVCANDQLDCIVGHYLGAIMARRRKNDIQGAFVLIALVVGGIGWLFDKGASAMSTANGGNVAAVVAVIVVAMICLALLRKWLVVLKEQRIRRSLIQKVKSVTQQHIAPLSRKRVQLLQPDAYGKLKAEKWAKELLLYFGTSATNTQ